jgi:fatty-acyl-CoA synthase
MYPTFDAAEAAAAVRRHAVTHTNATDEMFAQMLDARPERKPFPSVRAFGYSAFSPVLSDLPWKAEARGLKLVGLYGSSEMQGLFARQDLDLELPARIAGGGLLVSPDAQVRACDPDSGAVLDHRCPGELQFKGPSRMLGYFENEEASQAATTDDGWFRSGDLGYTTGDRRFIFLSRLGDAFRLSGFMVSPVEIEDVLQRHPDVEAAQVVSAETSSGLKAVAFVIPRLEALFDESALIAHCAAQVARYKVPIRIAALKAFPTAMSANASKIQKAKLREMAQSLVSVPAHRHSE